MAEIVDPEVREVMTPVGPARLTITRPELAVGTLVLGHGAGGQSWSKDVLAVRDAAVDAGWTVVLVDQPWRLAGRRVADRPPTLDRAWVPVLADVTRAHGHGAEGTSGPLVVGGRSAGARVACRTAREVGADAVLCLSFPLHPPGKPERSRADELVLPGAAGLPVLVVQGQRDPFGTPEEVGEDIGTDGQVVSVPGTHTLTKATRVAEVALEWLDALG